MSKNIKGVSAQQVQQLQNALNKLKTTSPGKVKILPPGPVNPQPISSYVPVNPPPDIDGCGWPYALCGHPGQHLILTGCRAMHINEYLVCEYHLNLLESFPTESLLCCYRGCSVKLLISDVIFDVQRKHS
jgi:hypothetical protein